MWLHAIALDEVRDMIGATDAEAARLRAIAAERFGRPRESSSGRCCAVRSTRRCCVRTPR